MIKAVLLDLDNTLLHNPDETFALEYLRLADSHFIEAWKYEGFSNAIRNVMTAFGRERDIQQTNRALAVETIADTTGRRPGEIAEELRSFYENAYPSLRRCTQPVAGAAELVEYLTRREYAVVIATNPIYPAEAVYQRLSWAGLPDDPAHYAFVTSADNMHFTKPHPAYCAEILGRVGIEPDEAIVVGDSAENDIRPAAMVGLHTYHVTDVHQTDPARASGTLRDLYNAIALLGWLDSLPRPQHAACMIDPQLRGNIGALFGLLDEIRPHSWMQHPDPDEWSALEIICHLVESENSVQRPRLERILAEDNPFLAAPKPPPGPGQYPCQYSGDELAHQFAAARQRTLDWLQTLGTEDWYRPARHSIFGPTTLLEMAHFTAQHDRLHLKQLHQTIRNCE